MLARGTLGYMAPDEEMDVIENVIVNTPARRFALWRRVSPASSRRNRRLAALASYFSHH